ncbi:uncharacterized protein LOC132902150 [Amyelois transitella]|uniref:uncharacterized protein LOC132902150 n=1 Tax=Amyelois transitella TaxID=680683 RepID=UPI002990697F|nr:uncharacterized protein LOC132902150 [Amyelois transitella]
MKKMKKLERKLEKRKRVISSSDDDNSSCSEKISDIAPTVEENDNGNHDVDSPSLPCTENDNDTAEPDTTPDLDPDILEILGDDPSKDNCVGEKLHKDIALRWTHILKNGMSKEIKTELQKQYLVPENCDSINPPKLNPEVKAAIDEQNLKKETYNEHKQKQLSNCLAAIGKALNIALSNEETSQDLIKPLSDAGRLLCDLHYRESQSRRYAIINSLNKEARDTVKNTKIDEYLFGSGLGEHLKSSKAIKKSGTEMKPKPGRPQSKPSTSQPQRGALNARGGSRVPESRTNPGVRKYTTAPAATTTRDRRKEASSRRYSSQRGHRR